MDIGKIIDEIRNFVEKNKINGEFTYTANSIKWIIGKYKYTYYIDFIETCVTKDKLTFNLAYRNITHYHIHANEIMEDIKEINKEYIS